MGEVDCRYLSVDAMVEVPLLGSVYVGYGYGTTVGGGSSVSQECVSAVLYFGFGVRWERKSSRVRTDIVVIVVVVTVGVVRLCRYCTIAWSFDRSISQVSC